MNDSRSQSGLPGPTPEMAEKLGLNAESGGFLKRYKWLFVGLGLSLIAVFFVLRSNSGPAEVTFRTAPVQRGDLTVRVTATGTIQPLNQVDVGAEISGLIEVVNVDFNDRVFLGQS